MEDVIKGAQMMLEKIGEEEYELEPGDRFVGVFKDGVIILSLDESRELKIDVILGEPEHFDFEISGGMIEEARDEEETR